MKLWFVDDRPANLETWSNSFSDSIRACVELRTFLSVDEVLNEFNRARFPDILFLDFFIGGRLGVELIRWFQNKDERPVLIAHSSMKEANLGMVEQGADFSLEVVSELLKDNEHAGELDEAKNLDAACFLPNLGQECSVNSMSGLLSLHHSRNIRALDVQYLSAFEIASRKDEERVTYGLNSANVENP